MKRRLSSDGEVWSGEQVKEIRKPLLELTTKGQKVTSFMNSLAQKENVDCKIIAALALQQVSSSSGDNSTSSFCKEIVSAGTFQSDTKQIIPIEKCTFLLAQLELSEGEYICLKRVCKSDGVIFAKYKDISQFRSDFTLDKELIFIRNKSELTLGIGISYSSSIRQTISSILIALPSVEDSKFL